ncbi:cell wall hydrolase [Sphingobium sp. CCH11-B1]|uniref:cell wall hydrolase n=1 Tax=Sphingobium sp. CCH11-B1 TaxID=1768781 RepID=UPI000834123B|nr:cell wall hydrolase [Sphingobium sp. CCH11-B1]MEA3387664.1 cell wall hydrolase [Pseudomonadota bacterium]
MTELSSSARPHAVMWLVWALILVGLPMAVAGWESRSRPEGPSAPFHAIAQRARMQAIAAPPPPVEPVQIYALGPEEARAFNAKIPFSRDPNPAARPFLFRGSDADLARATDCLAAAQLYEAGDDAIGEQAVAQVVLNRVRHPAFPKTVCGVVFQGQERRTGCQFTFTCDGALARVPRPAAWLRARDIARAALAGKVFKAVGYATHYHTDWVVPYWSDSLDKITAVGTHLFFRWRGWWGTPPAFRFGREGAEPVVGKIAQLSIAHGAGAEATPFLALDADVLATHPESVGMDAIGKTVAGVRIISVADAASFLVELPRGSAPDSWPSLAQTFCAGRAQCRIMGWVAGEAPKEVPLTLAAMAAMRFSYIHDATNNLQKALWNCSRTPRIVKAQCMRDRIPVAVPSAAATDTGLPGIRRKTRFETVRIAPPGETVSSSAASNVTEAQP